MVKRLFQAEGMIIETYLYKILSESDQARAVELGHTDTDLDAVDGYVHLSASDQVAETLALHYAGQANVHLYEFVSERLGGDVKWEVSRGGQHFPHLYAPLRLAEARRHWVLETGQNGDPVLPQELR